MTERVRVSEISEPEGKGNQSSGEGVKLYPPGKCRVCPNRLTQSNPLDVCYRCQALGIRGEPRKPIDSSKKEKRWEGNKS